MESVHNGNWYYCDKCEYEPAKKCTVKTHIVQKQKKFPGHGVDCHIFIYLQTNFFLIRNNRKTISPPPLEMTDRQLSLVSQEK